MIQWQHFPKSTDATKLLKNVIRCFKEIETEIDSKNHGYSSDEVLGFIRPHLERLGFRVETGKKAN